MRRSSASRYSGFRSPTRPPGSFNGPEGGKSLFSFNRTSGSYWRCKLVCRVKASIPAAIWATPPAPLPHRVRRHPRLQHHQPKFASSVTRLGESAAIGHSPGEDFFWRDRTVPSRTSRNRLPSDCRYVNQKNCQHPLTVFFISHNRRRRIFRLRA
jgi:hypothetical protein